MEKFEAEQKKQKLVLAAMAVMMESTGKAVLDKLTSDDERQERGNNLNLTSISVFEGTPLFDELLQMMTVLKSDVERIKRGLNDRRLYPLWTKKQGVCCKTIYIASTGYAASNRPNSMGTYSVIGESSFRDDLWVYKHESKNEFLYYYSPEKRWYVFSHVDRDDYFLRSPQDDNHLCPEGTYYNYTSNTTMTI